MKTLSKILKLIRINNGEGLKEMSEKLGISTSYLCAIENGKRALPQDFEKKINECYTLSDGEKKLLHEGISSSTEKIKIDVSELSEEKRKILFALTDSNTDDETITELCNVIKKGEQK